MEIFQKILNIIPVLMQVLIKSDFFIYLLSIVITLILSTLVIKKIIKGGAAS